MARILSLVHDGEDKPCAYCNCRVPRLWLFVDEAVDPRQFLEQNGGLCAMDVLGDMAEYATEWTVKPIRL